MKKHILAAAIAAGLALTATAALAQNGASASGQQAQTQQLSLGEIERRLSADGFRVLEVERYPRSVEVKGFDRDGRCVELHLDRRTGDVLRREQDDDCYDDDHGRGRGRD